MIYINIGKIVNTHGIKGEVRIISDFQFKDKIFKKDFNIYIGKNYTKEVINSYRHHKIFDMITLKGYDNINDVLKYKGMDVYILRSDLLLDKDEYLDEDLLNFEVFLNDKLIGTVNRFEYYPKNKLIRVNNNEKSFLIPYTFDIIKSISLKEKKIIIKDIKGLI